MNSSRSTKPPRLTIDKIHVVYRSSKRVTEKQLDHFENEFGAELPRGYRTFLTRFGHGWINNWLQIYLPDRDLIREQRNALVKQLGEYFHDNTIEFSGAKLTPEDIKTSIQIGIDQDVTQLFACRRFPGSVFECSDLDTIIQHKKGFEVLNPFAAMRMDQFAYFFPLEPVPEHGSLACQSKRLAVQDVVQAIDDRCSGRVSVIDVDEGPGLSARTPAFWLFPEKLGVKLHVYGVETDRKRHIFLTYGTSPKLLPKVELLIKETADQLKVKFKPARWY